MPFQLGEECPSFIDRLEAFSIFCLEPLDSVDRVPQLSVLSLHHQDGHDHAGLAEGWEEEFVLLVDVAAQPAEGGIEGHRITCAGLLEEVDEVFDTTIDLAVFVFERLREAAGSTGVHGGSRNQVRELLVGLTASRFQD